MFINYHLRPKEDLQTVCLRPGLQQNWGEKTQLSAPPPPKTNKAKNNKQEKKRKQEDKV